MMLAVVAGAKKIVMRQAMLTGKAGYLLVGGRKSIALYRAASPSLCIKWLTTKKSIELREPLIMPLITLWFFNRLSTKLLLQITSEHLRNLLRDIPAGECNRIFHSWVVVEAVKVLV